MAKKSAVQVSSATIRQLALLSEWYMLKLALRHGGGARRRCHKALRNRGGRSAIANRNPFDISSLLDEDDNSSTVSQQKEKIWCQQRLSEIESRAARARSSLHRRCAGLADRLGLDVPDVDLLILGAAIKMFSELSAVCEAIFVRDRVHAVRVLGGLIGVSPAQMQGVFSGKTSGRMPELIEIEAKGSLDDLLSVPGFLSAALIGSGPMEDCVLDRAFEVKQGQLALEDFDHLKPELVMLTSVLDNDGGGGHVLISGLPGIGKTQLAHLVASSLGWKALEVRCEDEDGKPASRDERFKHYTVGCRLLGKADKSLIIFDEAEDVFVGDHWTHIQHRSDRHKGWTNRLLESIAIPTVWISNSLDSIDPAYVRRFDYVLEMQVPPQSVRQRLAKYATASAGVSPALIERAAASEDFTPADADRLRRVLPRAISKGIPPDEAFTRLVSCRPGGVTRVRLTPRRSMELPYRPEWVNPRVDLHALISGLRRRGAGTLAFSGPPGTGKTELARHIARELDRPLHVRRASDLLGPHVGETEANIARSFLAAQQERAVLLLDEADSLLRDRTLASRSWEVTQVNELLSQLDAHCGVTILTTNNAESLDLALMRRMDLKLELGYMRPDDAWEAFVSVLQAVGAQPPDCATALEGRIRGMRELAFGDFVAATRGATLAGGILDAQCLHDAIAKELRLKGGGRREVGFPLSS